MPCHHEGLEGRKSVQADHLAVRGGERTHHDTAVEALRANRDDDVFADALEGFKTRGHETVGMSEACVLVWKLRVAIYLEDFVVGRLFDRIRFISSAGFVTFDVVSREKKNTIDSDDFTGF